MPVAEELFENMEFRAAYFQLLYEQAHLALQLVCASVPSVSLGMERVEDKVEHYLELAKNSPEFEKSLQGQMTSKPPERLFGWLKEKVDASDSAPGPGATQAE